MPKSNINKDSFQEFINDNNYYLSKVKEKMSSNDLLQFIQDYSILNNEKFLECVKKIIDRIKVCKFLFNNDNQINEIQKLYEDLKDILNDQNKGLHKKEKKKEEIMNSLQNFIQENIHNDIKEDLYNYREQKIIPSSPSFFNLYNDLCNLKSYSDFSQTKSLNYLKEKCNDIKEYKSKLINVCEKKKLYSYLDFFLFSNENNYENDLDMFKNFILKEQETNIEECKKKINNYNKTDVNKLEQSTQQNINKMICDFFARKYNYLSLIKNFNCLTSEEYEKLNIENTKKINYINSNISPKDSITYEQLSSKQSPNNDKQIQNTLFHTSMLNASYDNMSFTDMDKLLFNDKKYFTENEYIDLNFDYLKLFESTDILEKLRLLSEKYDKYVCYKTVMPEAKHSMLIYFYEGKINIIDSEDVFKSTYFYRKNKKYFEELEEKNRFSYTNRGVQRFNEYNGLEPVGMCHFFSRVSKKLMFDKLNKINNELKNINNYDAIKKYIDKKIQNKDLPKGYFNINTQKIRDDLIDYYMHNENSKLNKDIIKCTSDIFFKKINDNDLIIKKNVFKIHNKSIIKYEKNGQLHRFFDNGNNKLEKGAIILDKKPYNDYLFNYTEKKNSDISNIINSKIKKLKENEKEDLKKYNEKMIKYSFFVNEIGKKFFDQDTSNLLLNDELEQEIKNDTNLKKNVIEFFNLIFNFISENDNKIFLLNHNNINKDYIENVVKFLKKENLFFINEHNCKNINYIINNLLEILNKKNFSYLKNVLDNLTTRKNDISDNLKNCIIKYLNFCYKYPEFIDKNSYYNLLSYIINIKESKESNNDGLEKVVSNIDDEKININDEKIINNLLDFFESNFEFSKSNKMSDDNFFKYFYCYHNHIISNKITNKKEEIKRFQNLLSSNNLNELFNYYSNNIRFVFDNQSDYNEQLSSIIKKYGDISKTIKQDIKENFLKKIKTLEKNDDNILNKIMDTIQINFKKNPSSNDFDIYLQYKCNSDKEIFNKLINIFMHGIFWGPEMEFSYNELKNRVNNNNINANNSNSTNNVSSIKIENNNVNNNLIKTQNKVSINNKNSIPISDTNINNNTNNNSNIFPFNLTNIINSGENNMSFENFFSSFHNNFIHLLNNNINNKNNSDYTQNNNNINANNSNSTNNVSSIKIENNNVNNNLIKTQNKVSINNKNSIPISDTNINNNTNNNSNIFPFNPTSTENANWNDILHKETVKSTSHMSSNILNIFNMKNMTYENLFSLYFHTNSMPNNLISNLTKIQNKLNTLKEDKVNTMFLKAESQFPKNYKNYVNKEKEYKNEINKLKELLKKEREQKEFLELKTKYSLKFINKKISQKNNKFIKYK